MQPAGTSTPRPERGVPFSTRNIPLAAFLAAHGHTPRVLADDNRTCRFEFESNDALKALVDEFTNGHPSVNPVAYDTWTRSLRSQVQGVLEVARGRSA